MHLLYYGSQQEKLLHTERALKLLEEQSIKLGRQYDDPKSVDHIIPFVRRLFIPFACPSIGACIFRPYDKTMLCSTNLT